MELVYNNSGGRKYTMETREEVKKIPYGMSDYNLVRSQNYYYVDKSQYIQEIENIGRYLFFIRPRRFGKSFFLSLLSIYYDILQKERFEELFSGTWIYKNPTPERGKYLVLSFNFSQMELIDNKLNISFTDYVRDTALDFIEKYRPVLASNPYLEHYAKTIEEDKNLTPSGILSKLNRLVKGSGQSMYVIIDEYDNFANTLLTTTGSSAYLKVTQGEGILRSFFNVLKGGTTGADAPIKRLFITGVSPITMDDVTSGFNIGEQISLLPMFNQMLGFTRQDIENMLKYYADAGLINQDHNDLLNIIDHWYGNYLFSKHNDVTLYNTDMVLYFMKNYLIYHTIPEDLIDRNVRIDYGKLRHLIIVDKDHTKLPTTNGNFSKLKQIIETGEILSELVKGFPLDKITDPTNFNSLLFYFGLLTINGTYQNKLRLVIPNETVRRLYYNYIEEAYRETGIFSIDMATYGNLMDNMAFKGEWEPLLDYILGLMKENMRLRDLITGEKSVQAFLNVYLGLSDLYLITSEKELNMGYADIFMEPFIARYQDVTYAYLLELKYIPISKKPTKAKLTQLKNEAHAQLKQYNLDKKFQKVLEKTTLIKLVVIFCGPEAIHIGKVEQ